MNATKWTSLTTFVKYLGEVEKCKVDETENGMYVQWIDTSRDKIDIQETLSKKRHHDEDDEERRRKVVLKQIKASKDTQIIFPEASELDKNKLHNMDLKLKFTAKKSKQPDSEGAGNMFEDDNEYLDDGDDCIKAPKTVDGNNVKRTYGAPKLQPRYSPIEGTWFVIGTVVKIVTKKLGLEYRNKKGTIQGVSRTLDGTVVASVFMSDLKNVVLQVKQSHAETVIPDLGGKVLVVSDDANYKYRCFEATLLDIHLKEFAATIRIESSGEKTTMPYENICKLA